MNGDHEYVQFIAQLRQNIVQSRYIAARLANREQLLLYFKTGKMLAEEIAAQEWGAKVIEQIAGDLGRQLPGLKGFSARNLKNMRQFFSAYKRSAIGQSLTAQLQIADNHLVEFGQSATAQLDDPELNAFFGISFTHHILLLNKCPGITERLFYMRSASAQCWPVSVLEYQIAAGLYKKQGGLPNNFSDVFPDRAQSATQVFSDEYLMDFMGLEEGADEREVESGIVANIREFILRMGKGFSFIGNQYKLEVDGEEFFIDLLFYNRYLQCLVIFELKREKFRPEDAGKLNFYLNVLDEKMKLPHEHPSIGIILCKEKNNTIVEFSVKTINKAMGAATYKLSKKLPAKMKKVLPDTRDLSKIFYPA
jgi:predicted nuclease of restriction endonuclease-like (RecB) superfamily